MIPYLDQIYGFFIRGFSLDKIISRIPSLLSIKQDIKIKDIRITLKEVLILRFSDVYTAGMTYFDFYNAVFEDLFTRAIRDGAKSIRDLSSIFDGFGLGNLGNKFRKIFNKRIEVVVQELQNSS